MAQSFTAEPDRRASGGNEGPPRSLLLFDGECALCNGWVKFMLRRDRAGGVRFAPLQGSTAARILGSDAGQPAPLTTVVWVENVGTPDQRMFVRSDAALRAVRELGGFWRVLYGLRVAPRGLRDAVYDFVARNRYRWFGKYQSCQLPDPAFATRFLP